MPDGLRAVSLFLWETCQVMAALIISETWQVADVSGLRENSWPHNSCKFVVPFRANSRLNNEHESPLFRGGHWGKRHPLPSSDPCRLAPLSASIFRRASRALPLYPEFKLLNSFTPLHLCEKKAGGVVGFWLLAFSCWLLAVGCWLLAVGF